MTTTAENKADADDFLDRPLWGAAAIAAEIDKTPSQTFHLLEKGVLPATKVGKQWTSTGRRLRRFFGGGDEGAAPTGDRGRRPSVLPVAAKANYPLSDKGAPQPLRRAHER